MASGRAHFLNPNRVKIFDVKPAALLFQNDTSGHYAAP